MGHKKKTKRTYSSTKKQILTSKMFKLWEPTDNIWMFCNRCRVFSLWKDSTPINWGEGENFNENFRSSILEI